MRNTLLHTKSLKSVSAEGKGPRSSRSFRVRRRHSGAGVPKGFTLLELSASMAISTILSVSICQLSVTSVRTWQQEMRQNEMNMRGRQMVEDLSLDICQASGVVFLGSTTNSSADQATYTALGTCAFAPNPPTSQSFRFPSNLPTTSTAGFPAADHLVVFQLPSINSSGPIPGSFDYIGYGWLQAVSGTPGEVVRTCIPNSLSTRLSYYRVLPEAGTYDTSMQFTFHIATTAPNSPAPLTSSYPGTSYDPFAVTGATVPAGARMQDIDTVTITTTISAACWGATPIPSSALTSAFHMRDWTQT